MALCLMLLASYLIKIDNLPFIRLDDGELLQLSANFSTHGYLGSEMMNSGHQENLYYHVHPPLYYIVNGLVFKLTGIGILQSRLVSLLAALTIIVLTFLLSGKLLKLPLSHNNFLLLAVFFLSTPIFFVLARSNRPEMLALAFILMAILSYSHYLETKRTTPLIISGLCCGLAFTTQFYAIFVVLFLSISQLIDRLRSWRRLFLFSAAAALPTLCYGLWITRDFPAFIYQLFIARYAAASTNIINIFARYQHFFLSFETINTTIFFLLSLLSIFWIKIGKGEKRPWMIPTQPLMFILCFLAVFIFIPVLNKYYYVIILPFIYLFYIYALNQKHNHFFLLLISLYLIINLGGLGIYWHKYKNFDYNAYGKRVLASLPPPGNFSLLASPSLYPALRDYQFYAFNNGSIIAPGQTYEGLKARLDKLKVKYVIYQEYNEKLYAKLDYINQFLQQDCRLVAIIQDPYYGSEGLKKDNYIKIYSIIAR